MIEIEGFNSRLTKLRTDHPELDAKGAAILLQAQERTLTRTAFIFEDLEKSTNVFSQAVGTLFRKAAESVIPAGGNT